MRRSYAIAVLALGILSGPSFADEALQPGYKRGEQLQLLFREYLVTGPTVVKPCQGFALVCTYSTRPVVMVYARESNAPVIGLIKKLDAAVQKHRGERLGSYVVLFCDRQDRGEKELKALAAKEKIQHVLLSLVVMDEATAKRFDAKFGAQTQTTVILATPQRQVKASFSYRKDELKDADVEQILSDLPRIFPRKE